MEIPTFKSMQDVRNFIHFGPYPTSMSDSWCYSMLEYCIDNSSDVEAVNNFVIDEINIYEDYDAVI